MKILVTGGAGFIASNIVDRLIEDGHDVVVVDDLSTGNRRNVNRKAVFYEVDIQSRELEKIFREEKPDIVSHHAAQKDVRLSVDDPVFDARINVLGTLNVFQNAVKYGVQKIVFASTGGAIYGEQDVFPAPETHPSRPISPYGITKLVAEHYLYYYKVVHGMNYVSLRYSNVYGPRQDPHGEAGVFAIFIRKFLDGDKPIINGDGEQTRDFIYVSDVVNANVLAIEKNDVPCVLNIGTGRETSINQVFRILRQHLSPKSEELHGPPKAGEQKRSVLDCSLAESSLDWRPLVRLEDGLRMTCEYFANE